MKQKFNPRFYQTLVFWLGVLCIGVESVIWHFDSVATRSLGVGTGVFLVLMSLWADD